MYVIVFYSGYNKKAEIITEIGLLYKKFGGGALLFL